VNRRSSPRAFGALLGFGGIAIITVAFLIFGRSAPHAVPAMLLLVPIAGAGVVSVWRIAVPVAIVAACVYALAFIPPVGGIHIELAEDAFVLITFVVVAVTVGALTGPRNRPPDPALLDNRRAVLLRGVSHDLRTPLTTIHAISTELLGDGSTYDEGTRNQLLGRVVDESERLDRIVGNLLSVSRVQAGALNPNIEPESVEQLVHRSIARLNRRESHSIETDIGADLPDVACDSVQIDQVLTNLIENSLKHSPPNSTIRVRARASGGDVEITVSDTGPGFSREARSALFQPFHTIDHSSSGLGLAVCKAIVEAHGGRIDVRDEQSGGAHVWFSLPVYRDSGGDPPRRG
jgi:K+-sensing histidine kinase KdpD